MREQEKFGEQLVTKYTTAIMKLQGLKEVKLPDTPGVYFFRDEKGQILYVGKATSLKSRVRSYFAPDLIKTRGSKIVTMVAVAHMVTFQETKSVLEALILEASLIKKHKPYFNTKEKDDKSYNCIVITKEVYPRVLTIRTRNITEETYDIEYGRSKDRRSLPRTIPRKQIKKLFGPFPNGNALREAMKIIRRIFPFRDTCIPGQGTPCFNTQIGLCPGVCTGEITKKDYGAILRNLTNFFEGKRDQLTKDLKKQMGEYAKHHEFEKANEVKKTIFALDHIHDVALIKSDIFEERNSTDTFRIEAYDVAHISGTARVGVMVVVENGEPKKSQYRKFKLVEKQNNDVAGLSEILTRRLQHTEWQKPDIIAVDGGVAQKNVAEKIISDAGLAIPVLAIVKDDAHKPKDLLGDTSLVTTYKKDVLLANSEAHRFAISYHKLLRGKSVKSKK